MNENQVAETWLYSLLSGDAALAALIPGGVYPERLPEGSATPGVTFGHVPGTQDTDGVGGVRVWANLLYLVKVIDRAATYKAADDAYRRVDALLHKQSGSAPGGTIVSSIRQRPFSYPFVEDGIDYRQRGGYYLLQVQAG